MESQPPRLPWFRLATMARPAETAPPQPQPRPPAPLPQQPTSQPIVRPQVSLPTAPPSRPISRPITPPVQQDVPKPPMPRSNGATASPPPSPKVIKTSSPTPPPSPRGIPAPQVPPVSVSNDKVAHPEAEIKPAPELSRLKTIAMQEGKDSRGNGNSNSYNNTNTTNGINGSANTGGKINGADEQQEKKEIENGRGMFETNTKPQHSSSGTATPNATHKKTEKDNKVITIAGENFGAFMELGHNVHAYRKMHQGGSGQTTGSETQGVKADGSSERGVAPAKPMTSLVNSNVQSINNSLLFNSSCTQKSPGVHLTFKSSRIGKAHKPS